ncbi:acylphosphatase [Niabella beijingensis]|uniref:acylphosphatase n=1 Tax=Niabella beijingensis TaxID=2872700 RepID=UPI001CC15ECA|nr:acylphosphatase [Niabella beijingensis]MBZ4191015.1 acylphosphatase [Niabella beijingensis]
MKKIVVTGKVQGVFFRKTAKQEADRLHLYGSVENQDDGSVLIHVTGNSGALQQFINWCGKGPRDAVITNINITDIPETETYTSFEVLR